MNKKALIKFGAFSWAENLLNIILGLMPQFIRNIAFKVMFKKIGKNTYIDYETYFRYSNRIQIGSNTVINRGCKFFASYYKKDVIISIGNNVAIAPYCVFYSAGHDYSKIDLPDIAKSIIIDDNVWVGGSTIILPGVKIAEGAIIGAGSVVTKDIPAYSIAVGNPARVIKKRELIK